jgi:predicted transcriptional regulator
MGLSFIYVVSSFAKVLSERNRHLLALIAERRPDSLDAPAAASGRAKSNRSRTLHTMARYGLVRLEKGEGLRKKLDKDRDDYYNHPFLHRDLAEAVLGPVTP